MNTEIIIKNGDGDVAVLDKDNKHIILQTANTYLPNNLDIELINIEGTATSDDILIGKTAYVNGDRILGGCRYDSNTSDATATSSKILNGYTAYANGNKIAGNCMYDANTSDATATASDIIATKTAYVNGTKITGTLTSYTDLS